MVNAGSTYANYSVPISYNITYSSPISQTTSAGLGIIGFNTTVSNYFAVNVTIVNYLVNTMRITAIVMEDTVLQYLAVNYIAVGAKTYFLEVQTSCTTLLI